MFPSLSSGFRRLAHALTGTVCLVLLACSGGKDASGPNPPTDEPGSITGAYVLARINDSEPGQMVTLANPDGTVIGLYRFHENSQLDLTDDLTWTLSIEFEEEGDSHLIEDEGQFTREAGDDLEFNSAVFEDVFRGTAKEGVAAIRYDLDGDGESDTIFAFTRVLGPGS